MSGVVPTRTSRLAWAFLVVGVFASGLAYWQSRTLIERELDARLQLASTEVTNRLLRQVNAYAEVLRGVQAQFIVHPDLSRQDFQRLYRALSLAARLPGVQGIGFSTRVAPASREAFDIVLERELRGNDVGSPAVYRRAEIGSGDTYIVQYVEPIAVNGAGVGRDQSVGSIRLAAIERARDTGDLSVSPRLRFLAGSDSPEGAILFLPLYRDGTIPGTLDQRRAEFSGVVSIAVRLDDMLQQAFGPKLDDEFKVAIYDLQPTQGQSLQDDQHHLLFDSGNSLGAVSLHGGNGAVPYQRTEDIEIGGSTWRVQVTALPTLVRASQRWLPPLAALGTVLLSLLAFCSMRMLEHRRRAANARANVAEQALQSKEAQLSRISHSIGQYEAELEYHTNFDWLTGLPNRNLLRDRAEQALALAKRNRRSAWIVCMDLDRLKFVNDTLGHEAGDSVLQQVAQRLSAALPATDTVARANGDAFVVVLSDATDEHATAAAVQRLMDSVARPLTVKGHEYFLTCSAGVAVYPADGADAEILMRHADIAMHRAKELGRNTFQFYTQALNARAMERLRLEADLRHAVQRNQLVLHYQPQVDLHSGRMVGMEALVRWQHPQLGMVSPGRFIGVAEETGLISQIGEWVLRTACQQNKRWHDAGYGPLRVAVNVSANQFHQRDLMQTVVGVLEEARLAGSCLDIELTEGVVMTDVEHAVRILHQLKNLGVRLSIDDFGTGYSSLAYLRRLPVDVLKIDRSFVHNLTTNDDEASIVRSVIALAHSLGLQVIAEGVETEAQLASLRGHGCDQIQGYYFSEPLPADAFEQLLAQGKHLRPSEAWPLMLDSRP